MSEKQSKNKRGRADHLKPHQWEPGTSGNPGGRPSGSSWTATLRKLGKREVPNTPWAQKAIKSVGLDPEEATVEEVLLALCYYHAARGNVGYLRELFDRMEGPVPKKQEISGGDSPVEITVRVDRDDASDGTTHIDEEA